MAGATPRKLSDLIPRDIFVGTSLILRQGHRFLYGVRPQREVDGRTILELTGIGGGLEGEDPSLSSGVLREAREEIGNTVQLLACSRTLIVRSQSDLEWVSFEESERPAAVVFRNYRTPPHEPWHEQNQGKACIIVFAAELRGRPRPAMELPYLIWLHAPQILQTAQRDVPLRHLLSTGAELVQGASGPAPQDAWARLTDSQEALALALGERTLDFYDALGVT